MEDKEELGFSNAQAGKGNIIGPKVLAQMITWFWEQEMAITGTVQWFEEKFQGNNI